MGPETFITMGAQTVPNFLNIRTQQLNIINRLPVDVQKKEQCVVISARTTQFFVDNTL